MRHMAKWGSILLLLVAGVGQAGKESKVPDQRVFNIETVAAERAESGRPYLEFLRVESLNAGLYELAAGSGDEQSPHDEDEIYYVVEGRARFRAADRLSVVGPGSVIYVRAGVEHRFEEITEDLKLLVVFASGK